ncbi:MAG: hypothetical protein A3C07_05250 [Candidatus Sungbacteria bacterium RIFCSPHIGHO2_02_FULL_47_11]|uniref:Uncharacterized protein n=1 Tax=Candidatus Sungbacteria bacterium RIFCSPHIGHO2_02_FULL_47_11 TaxID=1802270 RepID=A0A1G2KNR0_9BACT|nr:MAG: hypothetical protein A3C07_05250 [Candidatus Sungbacteria bacterium RIFCSPHIGHO2_02_FULL_47_11]
MAEPEIASKCTVEVCKQDQLYIECSGIDCDEETRRWLEECEKKAIPLIVSTVGQESGRGCWTFLAAFSSLAASEVFMWDPTEQNIEKSFVKKIDGMLCLCIRDFNVHREVIEWMLGHEEDTQQFVVHSARFSGDTIRLTFMDPGKSKEVRRVAEAERAKAARFLSGI